jgi:uncharacterized membrane protein
MIRQKLIGKKTDEKGFRWRGNEVLRIEGFTDAVFAFAVTLLVVSLEVPKTFNELLQMMQGFIAFGINVTLLLVIWHSHYIFFRRYGLHDIYTIILNSILIFVVLFYIYPLKFLFTILVNEALGLGNSASSPSIETSQVPVLMIIYSIGYFAVFLTFMLFYLHAYRIRKELELNEAEILITRMSIRGYFIHLGISLLSILLAVFSWAFGFSSSFAGLVYFLLGPAFTLHGMATGKRLKILLGK